MLLQQDDARPRVACVTTEYLCQNNVKVMDDWPELSADLNPIEHCWDYQQVPIGQCQGPSECHLKRVAMTPAGLYPTFGEVYEA